MGLPLPSSAAEPWLAPALWLVARGTLLLAAAGFAALALRRGSAAARHLVWGLALAALLALPAASLLLPHWELPFVRLAPLDGAPSAFAASLPGNPGGVDWSALVLAAWAAGAALVLARYAVALIGVRVLARGARPVRGGEWTAWMEGAKRELGMRERVRLLRGDRAAMPMTWGVLRPVVLVPAEADGWTPERRRVVLLHELAHVARRDCLWQTLASLCCAAYWFHPGVWWAARRMRIEREQACDDRVLRAGTRASDYAGHLLEVARAFRPGPLTAAAAVAMARRSQLEDRVRAVLDAARDHGAVPGRAALVAAGVAAAALFPVAAATPGPAQAPAPALATAAAAPADAPSPVPRSSAPAGTERAPAAPARPAELPAPAQPALAPPRPAAEGPMRGLALADEPALNALIRATHDTDPEVRRSAVWALGQMEGEDAVVGPLVESMSDADPRVRGAAARALGEFAERRATTRIAAARAPPCEGVACAREPQRRAPTGSGPAVRRPRTARTDVDGAAADPGLRILHDLMEMDTLSGTAPVIHHEEM